MFRRIQTGQTVKAEIITIDTQERKIGLSMKSLTGREEEGDFSQYRSVEGQTASTDKATLGDVMAAKLGEIKEEVNAKEENGEQKADKKVEEKEEAAESKPEEPTEEKTE